MNRLTKKLLTASAALCFCFSSFSAYAAQITPSDTRITLGKNDKEISFDIYLETGAEFAGAEFGIKPSQSDVEFSSLTLADELKNESKVQTIKDGCLYFGFFSNTNKYSGEKQKIATLNYTYSGSAARSVSLVESKIVTVDENNKAAVEKGKSYFTLSLSEASRIANVQLTFETSTADVKIIGNNGFTVIGDISGEEKNGKYTGTAILGFLNADSSLFSSDKSAAIAKIIANAEEATVKITDLKASGWDSDKNVMYGKVNEINPSEAVFTDSLTYDVNGDGTVDLLDITEAQLYYRADKNSADWSAVSKCDFNGDGILDIEDYMAIWLNYTK